MGQPQRSQPPRSARLSSGALSSTTLPKVLEDSTLLPSDVKRSTEGVAGEGILVKLLPVSRKHTQSVSDSKGTLWIVSSPNASSGFPSKWKDAQKSRAKTTQPIKDGCLYERRANTRVTNGKAKGQRPLVKGKRKPLMSDEREKGDGTETDDPSDEEEEDAENDNDEEVEEVGDGEEAEDEEAEDEEAEEENGTENHNAAKDVTTVRKAVEDAENEHDAEKQDDDRNDGEHEEVQAKDADKRKDRDDSGEEDKEKDAQDEEEREKEAEREQEAGEAGDMVEKPSETKAKDDADKNEQADGNEDDEEAEEEGMGTHDEVREDREAIEQRVTANNRDRAWRDRRLADMTDEEGEERGTGSGGEERMAGEENGDHEERRKRPLKTCDFECLTPGDRPNKRSKSDDSESEDNAATDDLPERTVNLETTPRPKTPSPTSTAASPSSILEIVRQTSVVPGLENTEKAVWDAAQRDSTINSLADRQQTKLIHAALSLGSEEGIKEFRCFVHNARKDGMRGSGRLESGFDLSAPQPDLTGGHANNALISRDRGIAHFSTLYRHLDILDGKTTLFSIAKRAKLAAMAQYRKSILPEGAGKKQIRSATLRLFHAVWPHHDTIEKPEDKAKNPAAYADWIKLRDRLKEGRKAVARSARPLRW